MASKNSGHRSSVLSRRTGRRIIQNFLLVWLDPDLSESVPDLRNTLAQLRRIVASIRTFKNAQECVQFIQQVKDQKVFLIMSGALGQQLVPDIHEWNQIESIYIFCGKKRFHVKWSKNYPKVKGVHTHIEPICKALETDRRWCDQNAIAVSFQSGDPLFMYTQLVKEAILQIEYDEATSLKEFVAFCRQQEDIKEEEIQDVEKNYGKRKPIWWYTAPIFINTMLNRGLRVLDVDILMKMGFFISQLDQHIQELSRQQHAKPKGLTIIGKARFEVYRGQALTLEDFKKLKKSKGKLISFNNFLLASCNKNVSLQELARPAAINTDSVGILFIMQIDTDLCQKAEISFVEVTGQIGYFKDKEAEILFTAHTLFKIEKVRHITDPSTDRLYQVHLTVASPDTHELKRVADSLNKELAYYIGFSRLGYILLKCGLSEQARDIYHALVEKATTEEDLAEYNYQLGWAYSNLGEYEKAIHYYELNLEYKKKILPANHIRFAHSYHSIGVVYGNMGDYSKALSSHKKSLKIQKRVLPPNHSDLADSYNNIGNVYHKMGDYSKALSCYQQSLEIKKQVLPPNHPDLATSYNSIGNVYGEIGDYSKALSSYQQSLEIGKQALPSNHPDLAASYNNFGNVYDKMGDYSKALEYYQQSLAIWKQALPPNHPHLAICYNNIGNVYGEIGDYSKALSSYQQSLEIRKQVLPPNHPDFAQSYSNIGSVYGEIGDHSKALSCYQQSLEIQKQVLPPNHPDLAASYNNIGNVYDEIGDYWKALSCYQQSLEIQKQVLPPNHPDLAASYNNIGNVYENTKEHARALSYYEKALQIWQNSLPAEHPHIALVKENIDIVRSEL